MEKVNNSTHKHCCEQHIDIAFDDFLLENETFPIMDKCSQEVCSYCTKEAKYVLREDSPVIN